MAANDELIRLVLEFTGAATIEDATRKLAMMKSELQSVDAVHQQTSKSTANLGQSALAASYAVQDFTSQLGTRGLAGALGAIQNNIPSIIMGLGAGGGLTAVVSLLAVGVGLLASNWESVERLWGSGKTEEEIKRLKDLKKATEEVAEATKKMLEALNPEQKEGQNAAQKAVKTFGGKAVLEEISKALIADKGSFGAEADKQFATNLFGNVARGDVQANQYLQDILTRLPGNDINRVLAGGQTPAERRQELMKQVAEEKQELERAKQIKEQKDAAETRRRAEMGPPEPTFADKAEQERRLQANLHPTLINKPPTKPGLLPEMRLIPQDASLNAQRAIIQENALAGRLAEAMLKNQGQMTGQIESLQRQLQIARQLSQRLLQGNGMNMELWR